MTAPYELHHGDMLEVMPTLKRGSVAMVFADLPYGVTNSCDWDSLVDQTALWRCVRLILKIDGPAIFTASMKLGFSLLKHATVKFAYDLVWHKTRPVGFYNSKKMPLRAHENILCFYDQLPTYNPQMRNNESGRRGSFARPALTPAAYGTAKRGRNHVLGQPLLPHSVVAVASPHAERGMHPTQKPIGLLEWLVATYTKPGDTVLDPCFGSNTTGVACARLGRRYIGIEKDAEYFRIGKERLDAEHERLATGPLQHALAI